VFGLVHFKLVRACLLRTNVNSVLRAEAASRRLE